MPNLYFQDANKDSRDCTCWILTAYNTMVRRPESHMSHQRRFHQFQAANKDTRDCTSWTITAYNALHKGRNLTCHIKRFFHQVSGTST
ncbi:hypothetical protein CDAR_396751 [Caerostris darwini]|uniref:Uncharacterized protein n=1 Tax=Caerostris darwini TaxID=1538125 RepID=A0AAV4PKP3_9ARAC|nr:hypothetical protein CDAR_396751 [Caerostris darwini]